MQRYKIESNSQLSVTSSTAGGVVNHNAKIQNWKQFTTTPTVINAPKMLLITMQRYKIESNSQPGKYSLIKRWSC